MALHGLKPEWVRNPPRDIIVLKGGSPAAVPEPADVQDSRVKIERLNAMLAGADIQMPDDAWERISQRDLGNEAEADEQRRHRQYLGDLTAKPLFRVFSRSWEQGGRLYGGWWMGVPKAERRFILIDGCPTVELDYGQLHPTMLFAMAGHRLDYDPYEFGGFSRELGKETLMRMLNRTSDRGGRYVRRAGKVPLPDGISASEYGERLKVHLAPVRHLLGIGMGLRLQRLDSDLAIAVLDDLAIQGIVALPIHDSFIVKAKDGHTLRATMVDAFRDTYGFEPIVR